MFFVCRLVVRCLFFVCRLGLPWLALFASVFGLSVVGAVWWRSFFPVRRLVCRFNLPALGRACLGIRRVFVVYQYVSSRIVLLITSLGVCGGPAGWVPALVYAIACQLILTGCLVFGGTSSKHR